MENITPAPLTETTENSSRIPALLKAISEGLGISEMSLDEMVLEMRHIRESSDHEAQA